MEAFDKGAGHSLDFATGLPDGNKALNFFCMPCVLEIWPADLKFLPTHLHEHKYCFEAASDFEGVLLGAVVKAVYLNHVLFNNFLLHHESQDFSDFCDPSRVRVCGQNWKRFGTEKMYQATCGRLLTMDSDPDCIRYHPIGHKSNTGIWYCRACADYRVHEKDCAKFALP